MEPRDPCEWAPGKPRRTVADSLERERARRMGCGGNLNYRSEFAEMVVRAEAEVEVRG